MFKYQSIGGFIPFESDAPAITPQIDVEAGAETVTSGFANFRKPEATLADRVAVDTLGHEDDACAVGREAFDDRLNFGQVRGRGNHEFQLVRVIAHQASEDFGLIAQTIMQFSPAASCALARRGVGEFGADAHEIAGDRFVDGAGRLDGDMQPAIAKSNSEGFDLGCDHGLAAGDNDMRGAKVRHLIDDLINCQVFAFGMPGGVRSIAPGAAQIAAGSANEDRWDADKDALTLNREKNLGDFHGLSQDGIGDAGLGESFFTQQA